MDEDDFTSIKKKMKTDKKGCYNWKKQLTQQKK